MREELGGIHYALERVPIDEELTILTDSLSAIHLLCRWGRKRILTPYVRPAKCRDVLTAILARLQARTLAGTRTTVAKVCAHNSCKFNAAADHLAEKGASLQPDQGQFPDSTREWDLQYSKWVPGTGLAVSNLEARAAGLLAFPSAALRMLWGRNIQAEHCARAPSSYTADFLRRRNDSRDMLGCAFQDLPPRNAKTGIRLVTWQLPTMAKLVKWGKEQDSTCTCGAASESAAHVMLRCPTLSNTFTAAHDAVLTGIRMAL